MYIFQPPTSTIPTTQLLVLNTTESLEAANLHFTTISASLPFLDSEEEAFTPVLDHDGAIWVYAGSCEKGVKGSSLWKLDSANTVPSASETWMQLNISTAHVGSTRVNGANHLAAGAAFSSTNASSEVYVFGGMCPNDQSVSIDDWTKDASYSNIMLTIKPVPGSSTGTVNYGLGVSASRGPPIPEAGFTMTPLGPSYSRSPMGGALQQMSQNYVLLGGNTQQAFINMSQVALFSLPEQSWTFLPVVSPGDTQKTDPAARVSLEIEPRSGHTAVLSSDGKRVVMYGGWVGDIKTPANPQLAILELGDGYGGTGDWRWTIPSQSGIGPGISGLYGHGSVMLPGDVMMLSGGYSIPGSGKPRQKRAVTIQGSTSYFYNITSNSWIPSYTPLRNDHGHTVPPSPSHGSQSITASKRAGLGAGLVFGILALLAVVVFYFWYARRLKRRREAHEGDLRNLANCGQRANISALDHSDPNGEMVSVDHSGNHFGIGGISDDSYPWGPRSSSRSNDCPGLRNGDAAAERTGLLFEIPSPTRGLRRSLHSRGSYQPAPRYDDKRRNRGSGTIHPIDERDEYEEDGQEQGPSNGAATVYKGGYHILSSAPVLDPFQDPETISRSPSPESPARQRELEIQKWMNDWAAADARMHSHAGRVSPDKTDRTSSTLSDQSARSNQSGFSFVGSVGRSLSQRSAALFSPGHNAPNPAMAPPPAEDVQSRLHSDRDVDPRNDRSPFPTLYPRRATVSNTGATSISQLQRESETLLGGYSDVGPSSPMQTHSRARGWMGSVRRALTGGDRSESASPEHGSSASSSPTKYHHSDGGMPRRAASASAMLWQRRQGAKDWDVEGGRGDKSPGGCSGPRGDEDEWDVESAVENRVVQVMFTVPKEKLRVVNGAPEGDAESILSKEVKEASEEAKEKGKGKGRDVD